MQSTSDHSTHTEGFAISNWVGTRKSINRPKEMKNLSRGSIRQHQERNNTIFFGCPRDPISSLSKYGFGGHNGIQTGYFISNLDVTYQSIPKSRPHKMCLPWVISTLILMLKSMSEIEKSFRCKLQ